MKGILVLEDGSVFEGISIGVEGERIGKVVLNTAVVGYQEIMTDPANAGKILILTYPLIGNYGVAKKFYESKRCWIEGLVIKEKSRIHSNWQADDSFDNFLKKENLIAISDVDTRTLTVKIRDDGEMFAIISTSGAKKDELLKKLKEHKTKNDFIRKISVKKITEIKGNSSSKNIGILDIGIMNSFIKQLTDLKCSITLLPYNTDAEKILDLNFDGLIVSSGPEEDKTIPEIVETVKKLIGKIPILGISTGHLIISLALGGKLKQMKIGHHGVNYPVRAFDSFKGDITVQNHSCIVDEDSIKNKKDVKITLRNVNDETIEETMSEKLKFISTQYYPASPGFDEVNEVFKRFLNMTNRKRSK